MKAFTILTILLIINCSTFPAKIWRVNNNAEADADFTTLQDANNAALNGDTILVEGSATIYGDATITRTFYIVGTGYFLDENPETQANTESAKFGRITFNSGSEGSILTGFQMNYISINTNDIAITRNNISYTIWINSGVSNITIEQIYAGYISQIQVGANCQNITIRNNYLHSHSAPLIDSESTTILLIYNNIFQHVLAGAYTSIDVHNSVLNNNILINGDFIGTNNIFNNNLANENQFGTENGNQANVNMGNVFVGLLGNSTDGQWQLLQGSSAIGAGLNGEDCGMFGGSTPYVLSGMPTMGTSQGGLDIHLKAKTHN
jgi:hypothetical protein